MIKPLAVISCPVNTNSGYGARSRDFCKAIIELKKDQYDFIIFAQRWGSTSQGFIEFHPEWHFLKEYLAVGDLTRQPEIFIQITVPNEVQPVGKYNIIITAGIETNICASSWLEGCNKANLVLVSSKHSMDVFKGSSYDKIDNQSRQILEKISLKAPIEVLMEGIRNDVYYQIPREEYSKIDNQIITDLNAIEEKNCFLYGGMWLQGVLGEDRKNTGLLVKSFLETFKNKKNPPALVLKTQGALASYMDRDEILKKIDAIRKTVKGKLPNVYLFHGEISDSEMNLLYNHPKIKCMVTLTKGEGYGRPLLEFSLVKKPIIASGWSGQLDFLDPKFTKLIGGTLTPVHESVGMGDMLLKESLWFSPNLSEVGFALQDMENNYLFYLENAKRQAYKSKTEFSYEKMKEQIGIIFDKYVPKVVPIQLPKKISLPKRDAPKLIVPESLEVK